MTPEFLRQQLDCIFTDIYPDAIKIGMVSDTALIEVIAGTLEEYHAKNVVDDPVMVSTSGSRLLKEDAVEALVTRLFPMAAVVTPNIPEAEILAGMPITGTEDMERAAERIGSRYHCSVLLKGGHAQQETSAGHNGNKAADFLWQCQSEKSKWFYAECVDNPNTHGTGCTLSSAIAAGIARGMSLEQAVERAKKYVSAALGAMLDLGKGSGPMDHGFAWSLE